MNLTHLSKFGKYNLLSVSTNTESSFSHPTFEFVEKAVADDIAASLNFL